MRRAISFLLSLAMIFSMLPVGAFASEAQTEETVATEAAVDTTAATEAEAETTEPVTEEATEASAETEPVTEPATEASEEAEAQTEEIVRWGTYVPTVSTADSDELLEGWLYQQFYGSSGASFYGVAAGNWLNAGARPLYEKLKLAIAEVAAGERTSTAITVDVSDQGATSIDTFCLPQVIDALLHDCPYEMYWYDKTSGTAYSWSELNDGTIYSITLYMSVVEDLQGSDYTSDAPVADVSLALEAADAVANANAIAAKYAGLTTYEKLLGFKNEICGLTDYNDEAAASMDFSADADPWQLLWVFDGNDSTKVVCEGYSKAFQYLCDLDGNIDCYTVYGNMATATGGGGHMWNIVTLYGANYLVDVTNSDSGTAGYDGSLFLNGGTGSVAEGYTFSTAGGNILFTYDSTVTDLWGSSGILELSDTAYDSSTLPTVSGTYGSNITWSYNRDTYVLTISGSGAMEEKTEDVPWMDYQQYARELVIEEGITSIGNSVFEMHGFLESISIADSVTAIGDRAFYMNGSLRELKLSENLQSIGSYAFAGDALLNGVTVPDYLQTIGNYAFDGCVSLSDIRFTVGLTDIGDYAFNGCEALKTVTFLGLPANIGANAFTGVTATVTYPANAGWMDINLQNYGGNLTWVQEEADTDPTLPSEPEDVSGQTYELTFRNAMSGESVTLSVKDGEAISQLPDAPAVDGYSFVGWFSNESTTGTQLSLGDIWYNTMPTTWYAVYAEEESGQTMTQDAFEEALNQAIANGDYSYYLRQSVVLTRDFDFSGGTTLFIADGGSITVPDGITMNVNAECCMVILSQGTLTVRSGGQLNVTGQLGIQITTGTLNAESGAQLNSIVGGISVTLGRGSVNGVDTALVEANAYPTTAEELASAYEQGAAYSAVRVTLENSITLERDVTIPQNGQLDFYNYYGDEVLLTVPSGCTLTNNGFINVNAGYGLIVEAGGTLVNNLSISVNGGTYTNNGTEVNNGTINVVRNITNAEELAQALAEAGAAASIEENKQVYLRNAVTLSDGDQITVPAYVMLILNECLTVESGAKVTVQQNAELMTGLYDRDNLIFQSGSLLENYGRVYLDCGISTFAEGTYVQYQDGTVVQYVDATVTGIDKSLIHYNIEFSSEAGFAQALAQAQTGEFGSYNIFTSYNTSGITLSGPHVIPAGAYVELSYGSGLELLSGADVTNNGTIRVFYNAALTIADDAVLTNNGVIENCYGGTVTGTVTGNQPITSGGSYDVITVTDQAGLKDALAADEGLDIYVGAQIVLSSSMTVDAESDVCIPEGGALVIPSGKTLTVKSDLYIYEGSITVEAGGKLVVSGDGWIQNVRGTITNAGTVTVSGSGIWEYVAYGATSTGIDKSKLHGIVFAEQFEDILLGLSAAEEGYNPMEIVTASTMVVTESITIPENTILGTSWSQGPATVHIPAGVTVVNNGSLMVYEGSSLWVRYGGQLVNNGSMEVWGTYTNNGVHSGSDAVLAEGGTIEIGAPSCGDDLTFVVEDGKLTISGTGDMYDYTNELAPWYANDGHLQITEVVIESGVTSISGGAFALCSNLQKVTIGTDVASIGGYAFQDCTALREIIFLGSAPDVASTAFYGVTAEVYYPGTDDTWAGDKLLNYGGNLTWEAVFDLDQAALDSLIDNAPVNGDGCPMVNQDITISEDTVLFRDGQQVLFTGDITVPAGVTLTVRSEVLLSGKLTVAEGGSVVLENPDESGDNWVMLVDVCGAEINGTLETNSHCSFLTNDGAEAVIGETGTVNNYGTVCAEANGFITVEGTLNNYNFLTVYNCLNVNGTLNNYGVIYVENAGTGTLNVMGLLVNNGEIEACSGTRIHIDGDLNNHGSIHRRADEDGIEGEFIISGTLVNDETGSLHFWGNGVVRGTLENYGYLLTVQTLLVEADGILINQNRSVDSHGYIVIGDESVLCVTGRMVSTGDVDIFGWLEADGGEITLGGTVCNNGTLNAGHFYGGTLNITGTLYNEGGLYASHSVVDGQLYNGIVNISGEAVNNATFGIWGEANITGTLINEEVVQVKGDTAHMTVRTGAVLDLTGHLTVSDYGCLTVEDGVNTGDSLNFDLGTYGTIEGVAESRIDLDAVVTNETELIWALTQAAEHDYRNKVIRIEESLEVSGTEAAVFTIPEDTWLSLTPDYGEVVFAAGTTLVNNGQIRIGADAALIIAEGAVLENNGTIRPYNGWLIVNGTQTGSGTVQLPDEVWVTTEAQLRAAVDMGVETIYVQSAASYAARTVSTLTLTEDLTIPAGTQVIVLGVVLAIPEAVTLTVEGSMVISDGTSVTVEGALVNNSAEEAGLRLESGILTFGETGTYAAAEGAQLIVGSDFTITDSGDTETIPSGSVIRKFWVADFQYLRELLAEAAADPDTRYQIQINESFPIEEDVTVCANAELILTDGVTLSVPALCCLYNEGTITVLDWAELYINAHYGYVERGGILNVAQNGSFTQKFPAAESITLYADGNPGTITMVPGQTAAVEAVILPELAAEQELIWQITEGEEFVFLDMQTMTLTAEEEGAAVLRASATDGSGLYAELAVTVTNHGLMIAADSNEVLGGKSVKLEASWIPENITGTDIVWTLENHGDMFAKLAAKGNTATVTALDVTERQTVTVLAEAADGSAEPARFTLNLIPKAKTIALYNATWYEYAHLPETVLLDEYFDPSEPILIRADVAPAGASADVQWKSYNSSVVQILEDETLRAGYAYAYFTGNAGDAKITATTTDGTKLTAAWTVKVVEPITFEPAGETELELIAGETATLKLINTDTGKALTSQNVEWYVYEAMDADGNWIRNCNSVLSTNGKLTTKNVTSFEHLVICGDVTVDGCYVDCAWYEVDVYPKTTAVELYQDNDLVNGQTLPLDISAGGLKLSALQLPLDALSDVDWKSSKDSIATVEDGLVTFAGKTGTVTITATAADGSNKKATVKVEVGEMTETVIGSAPAATLVSGKSMTLTHTTIPAAPTKSGVTWSILEGAEYVKLSGAKLTAKTVTAPQEVQLVATSKDAAKVVSNIVTVTILPKTTETLNLMLDGELVTGTTRNAAQGDTFELSAWMFFSDLAKDEKLTNVTWTSNKPAVATVSTAKDEKAVTTTVTVVGSGSATITATGKNSDGKTVTATVTIKSGILSEGVKVTSDVFTVGSGKSITLKAETIPAKPTTKGVVWSLAEGDEAYAKLSSSGKLTAVKGLNTQQTVTVIVRAKDGASEPVEIPVTITPLATGVDVFLFGDYQVNGKTIELSVTETYCFSSRVYPYYGTGVNGGRTAYQGITWKSSNPKILTVDEQGNVTFGSKTGTVTITATAADGSGKKATFKVKTFMPVTELEIRDGVIAGGKTLKLADLITRINADATSKKLHYRLAKGDGIAFATLSNGQLKTRKVTSSKYIVIEAYDGYGYQYTTFTVTITPATTRVDLNASVDGEWTKVTGKTLELEAGKTLQITGVSEPVLAFMDYTWKLSGSAAGIRCYDENGVLTLAGTAAGSGILLEGVTPGKTVTLTATANDGSGKKATMKVKIIEARPE